MTEAEFEAELTARGCARIGTVEWEAGRVSPEHCHDFIARGFILEGEFTLETADQTRLLRAGDTFELAPGIPHVERVGPAGVRLLSGRLEAS